MSVLVGSRVKHFVFAALVALIAFLLLLVYLVFSTSYFVNNRQVMTIKRIFLNKFCRGLCVEIYSAAQSKQKHISALGSGTIGGEYLYAYTFTGSVVSADLLNQHFILEDDAGNFYKVAYKTRELDYGNGMLILDYYEASDGDNVKLRTVTYYLDGVNKSIIVTEGDVFEPGDLVRIDWNDVRTVDLIFASKSQDSDIITLNAGSDLQKDDFLRIIKYVD